MQPDFKIKYNIDNDIYRLKKEILLAKFDYELLKEAIQETIRVSRKDPNLDMEIFIKLSNLSDLQLASLQKKRRKWKDLESELQDMDSGSFIEDYLDLLSKEKIK